VQAFVIWHAFSASDHCTLQLPPQPGSFGGAAAWAVDGAIAKPNTKANTPTMAFSPANRSYNRTITHLQVKVTTPQHRHLSEVNRCDPPELLNRRHNLAGNTAVQARLSRGIRVPKKRVLESTDLAGKFDRYVCRCFPTCGYCKRQIVRHYTRATRRTTD
jgi:hypothetical protein